MNKQSSIENELAVNIDKTRKQVTILFTDIVDSSRYWDQFGDVKGRMMVDLHNRLVFPVIKKFRGRIIKTIGDGLMASFKRPNDALNAGIGIQQILRKMRDADRSFNAKVRIGLHTGMAIVEDKDVYGDVVNVANRVEEFGEANEIVLSNATVDLLNDRLHVFHKKGSFIPKGKREPMTVYRCRWNEYKDLARGLKVGSYFPLDAREKGDIVAYCVIFLLIFVSIYHIYIRYFVTALLEHFGQSVDAQILALNPLLLLSHYPFLFPVLFASLLFLILILIWIKTVSYLLPRVSKGIMGFGLGFLLIYCVILYAGVGFATGKDHEVFKSKQKFVVMPYSSAADLLRLDLPKRNWYQFMDIELLIPVSSRSALAANLRKAGKKLRNNDRRGKLKKDIGVWTTKNLVPDKPKRFYFRLLDLCAVCLGVLGFVSGFMNLTIRPS